MVRGNCPQSALSYHTDNLVFGCSMNPIDVKRSCGGSSGGDAGLIAARCVPFAVGSDIGGSLRVPAAFCGIYGLKPTTGRITNLGKAIAHKMRYHSFNHLQTVLGPMGGSVEDLVISMEAICHPNVNRFDH